jgi:uroporphyrinogen decarboxylase
MSIPLLDHPAPDFAEFCRVLAGEQMPRRVHLVEIGLDEGILKALTEQYTTSRWFSWEGDFGETPPEPRYEQLATLFYRLGYDYVPIWATWPNHPEPKHRITADTAELATSQRKWVEEGLGLITSWQDLEAFPWDAIRPDVRPVEYTARHLPGGMKLTVQTTLFEHILENLLGYEGLSYLLYDEPELVRRVFERWGQIVYNYYAAVIGTDAVGAIFHADDMGFKTATLVSPDALRELVLPWLRRYADLAHAHGKPFWLHSCGNLFAQGIIDDLIADVGIDGFHSFQDVILPVAEFKARYGGRVATLGGVDMDRLARLDTESLRAYIRTILETCMPGGRFALGSGNTIANYIPLENYGVLLEETLAWEPTA